MYIRLQTMSISDIYYAYKSFLNWKIKIGMEEWYIKAVVFVNTAWFAIINVCILLESTDVDQMSNE